MHQTLAYLRLTGRPEAQISLIEAYMKAQGMFRDAGSPDPTFTDTLELDLAEVRPSLAGPRRPHDRVLLSASRQEFRKELVKEVGGHNGSPDPRRPRLNDGSARAAIPKSLPTSASPHPMIWVRSRAYQTVSHDSGSFPIRHGSLVIAAITSCTNTSNPSVLIGAGLLAKKAVERGLSVKPWVKTSLAPGSKVVTQYLKRAGLTPYLDQLHFNLVGYGCTTCIGNSGPVAEPIAAAVKNGNLVACAILSGNRNFEGRINPVVRFNYLASPPLVVAYALAGTMDIDLNVEPLGRGKDGKPVYLRELWPSAEEINATMAGRGQFGDVPRRIWPGLRG